MIVSWSFQGSCVLCEGFLRNSFTKCHQHSDLSFVHPSLSVWCPILVMSPLRWIYSMGSLDLHNCYSMLEPQHFVSRFLQHLEISCNSNSTTTNPFSIPIVSWLICSKSCFFSVIQLLRNPAVIPESKVIQVVLVAQSCPILCDSMDDSPNRLLCSWNSPGKNTEVCCHFLLQGIFLTQGWNLGLRHCRQTLYHLSHQGSLSCKEYL